MPLTFGSLFAGIGGFDLGFERAGLVCKWQVEIDPYCQRVLAKHWPHVKRHDDVKTFPPSDTAAADWGVDVICGGFPCQDISNAGKREGIGGARSGLWREFARIIRVVRPRYVVVENVAALLDRGMGTVLGDLVSCGFDAEWDCLPTGAFGAVHLRERTFLVAYPASKGREVLVRGGRKGEAVIGVGTHSRWPTTPLNTRDSALAWLGSKSVDEPPLHGIGDGVPNRVDRLRGLGNAVVPQVAEFIGRRLIATVTGA